jgi:hypothetical protein
VEYCIIGAATDISLARPVRVLVEIVAQIEQSAVRTARVVKKKSRRIILEWLTTAEVICVRGVIAFIIIAGTVV